MWVCSFGGNCWIRPGEWASLQGLVRIEAERYHKATGKTERGIRYYITIKPEAARLNPVMPFPKTIPQGDF